MTSSSDGAALRDPAPLPLRSISGVQLGDRLRDLRKLRGWTLADVSAKTGLAVSTLSKVENNKISLTYHNLAKLAGGLELDLAEFFTPVTNVSVPGRSTVSRRGGGKLHETPNYAHEYLCVDLAGRRMVPMLTRVKARTQEEFGPLIGHPGEEFIFVSEGAVDIYREGLATVRLRAGDSFYFDSSIGHAVINVGAGEAYTLTVISPPLHTAAQGTTELPRRPSAARPR